MDVNKIDIKNFVFGILTAVIGLIVVIFPKRSIEVVVILLGICAIISGIYNLIKVYKISENPEFRKVVLVRSIISIVLGILAVVLPFAFIKVIETIVKVLLYVEAVYLILSAFAEIFMVEKLKSENANVKNLQLEILGSILIAVLLFLLAANFGETVVRILGVVCMIAGISYSIYYYFHKPIVVEAENVRDLDDDDSAAESNAKGDSGNADSDDAVDNDAGGSSDSSSTKD